jgi:hypothetical protein
LFYRSTLLRSAQIHLGMLQAPDVFRGAPAGARLLEVDAASYSVGDAARATVINVCAGSMQWAGELVGVDVTNFPFLPRTFAGVVCRVDPEHCSWGRLRDEIRRVVEADGAFYLELPHLRNVRPAELISVMESGAGLPFRWWRPLGRSMAPRPSRRAVKTFQKRCEPC